MPISDEAKQKKREYQKEYEKRTRYASQNKYQKNNAKSIMFRMYTAKDADLIEWFDKQPKKHEYLRNLIRADMERRKGE